MKTLVLALAIGLLAGCATSSDELTAISPQTNIYANYDCGQLEQVCNDTEKEILLRKEIQNSRRNKGKLKMTLNVLVLPVFWGDISDDENTTELQKALGRYEEAARIAEQSRCGFKTKNSKDLMKTD